MDFGQALAAVKTGSKIARQGWNGKDMYVEMQVPDEHSKMRRPYLFMRPVDGDLVPWVASQTDLLAEDWVLAGGTISAADSEAAMLAGYRGVS